MYTLLYTVVDLLCVTECLIFTLLQHPSFRCYFLKDICSPSKWETRIKLYQAVYFSYYSFDGSPVVVFVYLLLRNLIPDTMMTVFVILLHLCFVFLFMHLVIIFYTLNVISMTMVSRCIVYLRK